MDTNRFWLAAAVAATLSLLPMNGNAQPTAPQTASPQTPIVRPQPIIRTPQGRTIPTDHLLHEFAVQPDVAISIVNSEPAPIGKTMTFSISPYNMGPTTVSESDNVAIFETVPGIFTIASIDASGGWSCARNPFGNPRGHLQFGNIVNCTYGGDPVAPGAMMPQIEIVVTVASYGHFQNCPLIAIKNDRRPLNNRSCAIGDVQPGTFDLAAIKIGPESVGVGEVANFSLGMDTGPQGVFVGNVPRIVDTFDPKFTNVTVMRSVGWTCTTQADPVTSAVTVNCLYYGASLTSHQSTLTDWPIEISAVPSVADSYQNCATVSSVTPDWNSGNDTKCITVSVGSAPSTGGLTITKTVVDNCRTAENPDDSDCIFKITVTNTGSSPYSGTLTVSDLVTPPVLAADMKTALFEKAWGSPATPTCDGADPTVCTMTVSGLASGESEVFYLEMTVNATNPDQNCATLESDSPARGPYGTSCVKIGR